MFDLHERLAADTIPVVDWPLCRVLLMKDANYPWLILVPRRHGVQEIHELDPVDQLTLIAEICRASHLLQNHSGAFKMNVGALGNMVPQLHIHVIARFQGDAAWPRPVWGAVPALPYDDQALFTLCSDLTQLLSQDVPAPCC